ncbi:MAG TPA: proline dehydrogenase family protein [Chitinophagaceae bacterium]|nr:proline dehydrogenase family protein [Chitinophagaceae bacterium]HNF70861.1 proline dehydrogenase family protein [Chitinophagaceae bacterium]
MELNFNNTQVAFRHKSNAEIRLAFLLFSSMARPWITKSGIAFTKTCLQFRLPVKWLIKGSIFRQFCGGETLEEADQTARKLATHGVHVIMDYGVEGKSDEKEFEQTTQNFLKTISFSATKEYIPFVSLKFTGFCRFELLEKLHDGSPLSEPEVAETIRFRERVDRICAAAAASGKMILIDAEESWIQNPVDQLCDEMMAKYNRDRVVVFNTFQLYRHDRFHFLKQSYEKASAGGYLLGAKLVRGAYMEKERFRANDLSYTDPIQPDKASTDRDYDDAATFCLQHIDRIALFAGTHNEASTLKIANQMKQLNLVPGHPHIHFSQLFGMSDNISFNLAAAGYQVSKYLPYGPVQDVIPYLMRRAEENTSVAGQTSRELNLIRKEMERRKKKL